MAKAKYHLRGAASQARIQLPLRSYFLVVTPCLLGLVYLSDQMFDPSAPKTVTAPVLARSEDPPIRTEHILTAREAPAPLMEALTSSRDEQVPPMQSLAIPAPASDANAAEIARPQSKKPKRIVQPQKPALGHAWSAPGAYETVRPIW